MLTFGRAISATDYEVVASQAPGVSRAAAYWTFDGAEQRTLVTVYVGDDAGGRRGGERGARGRRGPEPPCRGRRREPDRAHPVLHARRGRRTSRSSARGRRGDGGVSDSAGGLFSPGTMGIGQRLYRSDVDAALMVPGAVAVHDLAVTWSAARSSSEVFDPGEGAFFDLPPATSRSWG